MLDLLRKALRSNLDPREITPEDYSEWRNSPVTSACFTELIESYFDLALDDDLILTVEDGLPEAFAREGTKKLLRVLLEWKPEHLIALEEAKSRDSS